MPHILLVRLIGEHGFPCHGFPAVVHNDVLAVGIDRGPEEEDHVIENLLDRRVRCRKSRRMREPHIDLPIVIELRIILRRCDDGHGEFTAERGLADIQKMYAIARLRQFLEVGDGLFIIEHLAVGANRVAEK